MNKLMGIILCPLLSLAMAAQETEESPDFGAMVKINVDGQPLTLNGSNFASPLVTDWDGDGKKDLLIGEFAGHMTEGQWKGKIRFYSNVGTDASPEFSTYSYLKAGGKEIAVSQHWCIGVSNPHVGDLNGDGINDLVFGEAKPGSVFICTRNKDGSLNAMQKITAAGKPIELTHSAPVIVDWNGDKLLDLLVCGGDDPVRIYLNEGTAKEFKFNKYQEISASGKPIKHVRAKICVSDLDGDGKKDLIVGTNEDYGQLLFYKNTGTDHAPEFVKPVAVKFNGTSKKNFETGLAFEVRACVADWNNDGIPDLIVGDNSHNSCQKPKLYCVVFLGKKAAAKKPE